MSTKFTLTRDINGYNGFGLPFSTDNYKMYLTQSAAQSITVPSKYEYYVAIFSFSPNANIWVDNLATAVVATGTVAATTSVLNPSARVVKAGQSLSFITSDSNLPNVGVSFYVIQPYGN